MENTPQDDFMEIGDHSASAVLSTEVDDTCIKDTLGII